MPRANWSRRDVIKTAAAAVGMPWVVPAGVLGRDGQAAASETVRVGVIGCGGRARFIREVSDVPAFRVVAVCDCQVERAETFARELSAGARWNVYADFQKMIEKEGLDAVMVETTTHARAWVAMLAMQAGIDAYIEKPMSLSVAEGRAMVDAARKYRRVTQVGTQQRSMPINNWASDLVKNGALGKIETVLAPNFVGPFDWRGDDSATGEQTTEAWWNVWSNQAPLRPYQPEIHRDWARWRDYDGGGLCFGVTGWGAHSLDQVNRALGADDAGPVEIVLEEPVADRPTGRFAPRASVGSAVPGATGDVDTGADYHAMARLHGPRARVTMTFASGVKLKLHLDGDRGPGLGAIFIGEKGKIEINRNKVASNPRELIASADNPGPNRRAESTYHVENWIECIKSRERCNADIAIAQRASNLCHLVNIVREVGRVGEALKWDSDAERFTNCDEANRLLSRPRRAGYELPSAG